MLQWQAQRAEATISTEIAPQVTLLPTLRLCDHWRGSFTTGTSSILDGRNIELFSGAGCDFVGDRPPETESSAIVGSPSWIAMVVPSLLFSNSCGGELTVAGMTS